MKTLFGVVGALVFFGALLSSQAEGRRVLRGHLPGAVMHSRVKGRLSRAQELEVAIGLPLRNREALTNLLQQLYDPTSPRYRQFLKPAEFAAQFGPSERDYQAVMAFARANHLRITRTHPNRVMLHVAGSVADLEQAFQIRLNLYEHPTEARAFYAPESEPSVLETLAVLDISGLDDFRTMQPMDLRAVPLAASANLMPNIGSGPLGTYRGSDFRAAYAPDVTLTGRGQVVGIVAFDGYYPTDIRLYERQAGQAHVPLQNVVVGTLSSPPGRGNLEVATDIEMALSMAPGLARIVVYQAPNQPKSYNDVLNRMATDNLARQLSSSWGMHSGPSATTDQIFQQFAAQGQSFFQASGDTGAYARPTLQPTDNPYITVVGGTTLNTWGPNGAWLSETVWRYNRNHGSSGGISTVYPIPPWQQSCDMTLNLGSSTLRNLPDVAMVADNIAAVCNNGRQYKIAGTSASAPLWAGFMALVNEQAANCHQPPVGFANPALYALAQSARYPSLFHDIRQGDNTTTQSPDRFYAVPGYDLCTGWGTPQGQQLIDDLTIGSAILSVAPDSGFTAKGKVGGPFDLTNVRFALTNSAWRPTSWSLGTDAAWLATTPTAGTLIPDRPTFVSVSLSAAASDLVAGTYTANVWFTNLASRAVQTRTITLQVVPAGALQVTLSPPEAVTAGARWQVDGGMWYESGTTLSDLSAGSHTVTFSPANSWVPPGSQTVLITDNQTAPVNATYQPQTSLQVILSPPEAVTAGARWQVDGGMWYESGATISNLATGSHTVSFAWLWGWESPSSQTVTIGLCQEATATGTYARQFGSLRVTLGPSDAISAGARWQVDGGPWQESGATVSGLAVGYHSLGFSSVNGRTAPNAYYVSVWPGLTTLTSTYDSAVYSSLQVLLYPTNASTAGARWQVDGGPWQESGATVSATVGWHTVSFSSAEGWMPPDSQTLAVNFGGATTVTTGIYAEPYLFTTIAGAAYYTGTTDGPGTTSRFNQPSGITVDRQGNVLVTDSGNSTIRKLTWAGTNWMVSTIAGLANQSGHRDGTNQSARFTTPWGITLNTNGNVYVADSGDCTIRQLKPLGTKWVVSTIAGLAGHPGSADGAGSEARFNCPAGITADHNGNLYVADTANYTIRKLTLEGTRWQVSTIAGRGMDGPVDGIGTNAGLGELRGITADRKGNLFVVDAGTPGLRQLTLDGADWVVTTIAGHYHNIQDGLGTEAGFVAPRGLANDAQGNLYVSDHNALRKVSPEGSNWLVRTIGGPLSSSADGVYRQAGFTMAEAVAADAEGRVFVTDFMTQTIRLGTLVQAGALRVTLAPNNAVRPWAQWRVDGGPWQRSTGTDFYLPVGEHTVSFEALYGWMTPTSQTVVVYANQTTTATGLYLPVLGSAQATLTPSEAVSAGARWQVDGGPWQETGATISGLRVGYHTVVFCPVSGWDTPTSQTIVVGDTQTITLTSAYQQQAGALQVSLNPSSAVNLGAQWQVDGGPWQSNRTVISGLSLGAHTVAFKDIPQWNTPVSLQVTIGQGATNITAATYTPWETTSPALTIMTPPDQRWNYPQLTVMGKASDNMAVAAVWYQLNASEWALAHSASNWVASVELQPGTNTFRAYAVDFSGNKSITNCLYAVYAPSAPLGVQISGSGSVSPNYNGGMLEPGKSYTVTATPAPGFVFSNWTGGVSATSPTLTFVMWSNLVLQANFIPNPFAAAKGTYNGLFAVPAERRQESSGSLNLALTDRGTYSGVCLLGGKAYALSGQFDVGGNASNTIVRAGSPALTMNLTLEWTSEANRVTGYLSDGQWVAELTANRAVSDGLKDGTPAVGQYTLILPGGTNGDGSVFLGDGYGAVSVSASGRVTLSGALAEGTLLSQSAALSEDGRWPLYVALYGGKGSLWGWLSFETNQAPDSLRGVLSWIRPTQPAARLYPAGFTNTIVAEGARYTPPASRTNRVIALTEGSLSLEGGNLRQPFANLVQLTPDNRVVSGSSNRLSLTFLLQNGLFSGSVTVPGTAQSLALKGALLQNRNAGYGYFLGTNQSGRVFLGSQ